MIAEFSVTSLSPLTLTLTRSYTWGLDIAKSLTDAGGVGALLQVRDYTTNKDYLPSYDGNGNIVALFDADASSSSTACVAAYEYSPYGEFLRCEGTYAKENPFRFSTKFTDDETGLVYYGRRYYSPAQGRFLGRDPKEEKGGLNLYGFCRNNSINLWDLLGMEPDWEPTFAGETARVIEEIEPGKPVYVSYIAVIDPSVGSLGGDREMFIWVRQPDGATRGVPQNPGPGVTNPVGGFGGSASVSINIAPAPKPPATVRKLIINVAFEEGSILRSVGIGSDLATLNKLIGDYAKTWGLEGITVEANYLKATIAAPKDGEWDADQADAALRTIREPSIFSVLVASSPLEGGDRGFTPLRGGIPAPVAVIGPDRIGNTLAHELGHMMRYKGDDPWDPRHSSDEFNLMHSSGEDVRYIDRQYYNLILNNSVVSR